VTTNLTLPAALPPGFIAHTCVSVQCGTCHTDFGDGNDGPGTLHFDTVQEAATTVTEDGWWVTTTGVQCGTCAERQACATHGHIWGDWRDCGCGCHGGDAARIPTHTRPAYNRWCDTCDEWEWQEPA
jgi:hypothetical protein